MCAGRQALSVVAPRVGPGLDRGEPVAAVGVGEAAAHAGEVRVDRGRVLVALVDVAAGGVGLPDLDQLADDRPAVAVEHPAGDDHPLAHRLAAVLDGQVGLERVDVLRARSTGATQLDRLRVGVVQVLGRVPQHAAAVRRVVEPRLGLRPRARVALVLLGDRRDLGAHLCLGGRGGVGRPRRLDRLGGLSHRCSSCPWRRACRAVRSGDGRRRSRRRARGCFHSVKAPNGRAGPGRLPWRDANPGSDRRRRTSRSAAVPPARGRRRRVGASSSHAPRSTSSRGSALGSSRARRWTYCVGRPRRTASHAGGHGAPRHLPAVARRAAPPRLRRPGRPKRLDLRSDRGDQGPRRGTRAGRPAGRVRDQRHLRCTTSTPASRS